MRTAYAILCAALALATFAAGAEAQNPAPGRRAGPPLDCGRAENRARCAASVKGVGACQGKVGEEHRRCMREAARPASYAPPKTRDCSQARNRERCLAHNVALEACKDKVSREEHRKCMAAQLAPPAPAKR